MGQYSVKKNKRGLWNCVIESTKDGSRRIKLLGGGFHSEGEAQIGLEKIIKQRNKK